MDIRVVPTAQEPRKPQQRLQAVVGIAVSVAGLAVYVYLLGGMVMWLRFTAARLPADEALGAVDTTHLLALGFKTLLFTCVLLLLLTSIAWVAWRLARLFSRSKPEGSDAPKVSERAPEAWAVVLLGIGLGMAVVPILSKNVNLADNSIPWGAILGGVAGGFVGALFDEQSNRGWVESPTTKWIITALTVSLALFFLSAPTGVAVLVFVGLAHFGAALHRLPSVDNPAQLIPAVLILGACTGFVVAAYLATPPVSLDRVTVVTQSGRSITGGYLGRSGEGVAMTRCTARDKSPVVSRKAHILVVPSAEVKSVALGGASYAFDYGKDPSLVDLGRYYFQRDGIDEPISTASIDFRANRLVCGLTESFRIAGMAPDPRRGKVVETVDTYGEGTVRVDGDGIKPMREHSAKAETIDLAVRTRGNAMQRLKRKGVAVLKVRTTFTVKGEDEEASSRIVEFLLKRRPRESNAR